MSGFRVPEQRRQEMLLWDAHLDDAISPDHPVRAFDAILRSKTFRGVFRDWEADFKLGRGQPPFRPIYLVSLYCYGLLCRVRSSRQLEAACHNRIDFMWLMEGQTPDHTTIANFVKTNMARLREIFKKSVAVAKAAGLVSLNHVAIDGTKVAANASKDSVRSSDRLTKDLAQAEALLEKLEEEWKSNESRENDLV